MGLRTECVYVGEIGYYVTRILPGLLPMMRIVETIQEDHFRIPVLHSYTDKEFSDWLCNSVVFFYNTL